MALTYRLLKGAELTYSEGDNNIKFLDLKMKLSNVAPAVTNDSSQGFTVNESTWFNYATGILYLCTDTTVGAAVWNIVLQDTTYTDAQIKTKYENNADTNAFTDAEKTKLAGIETFATADQTGAEIKLAYEAELDTNAFTDAEKTKLSIALIQGTTGTTASRPTTNLLIGQYYYDTTLSKPIWYNGTAWTDGMGTVV